MVAKGAFLVKPTTFSDKACLIALWNTATQAWNQLVVRVYVVLCCVFEGCALWCVSCVSCGVFEEYQDEPLTCAIVPVACARCCALLPRGSQFLALPAPCEPCSRSASPRRQWQHPVGRPVTQQHSRRPSAPSHSTVSAELAARSLCWLVHLHVKHNAQLQLVWWQFSQVVHVLVRMLRFGLCCSLPPPGLWIGLHYCGELKLSVELCLFEE